MTYLFMVGFAVAFLWLPVSDIDLWWHLKSGEVLWQTKQMLRTDIFSYTAFGNEWLNHEWLFQVCYYLLQKTFGNEGILFVRFLFGFFTLTLLYQTCRWLTQNKWASFLSAVLLFRVISVRFTDRPSMLTTLLICFVLWLVTGVQSGRLSKKGALWLFPVFLGWANFHAGVLLGLVLLFFLGLSKPSKQQFFLFLALLVTTLVNPWGVRILTFPFENLQLTVARSTTMEWMSAFQGSALTFVEGRWLFGLYGIVAFCMIFGRLKLSRGYYLCLFFTALMATKGVRFVAEFAIFTAPLLALNLHDLENRFKFPPLGSKILYGLVLVALTGRTVPFESLKTIEKKIAASALPHYTPDLMVFLNQHQIHGRVFNDMNLGPSFIYFRWPEEKVFFDTRHSIYGNSFHLDYLRAAQDPRFFEILSDRYGGFDYAVLEYWSYAPSVALHAHFWTHPDWHLVYYSNKGFIYLKNSEKFKAVIQKFGFKEPPPMLKAMAPALKAKQ